MGINHGRADIAVPEKRLDCADIVIGLQKMCSKTMAEGVRCDAFGEFCHSHSLIKSLLDMLFMQMITPLLFRFSHKRKRLLREEPLPDEFLCRLGIFLFQLIIEKCTRISRYDILVMETLDNLKLCRKFGRY